MGSIYFVAVGVESVAAEAWPMYVGSGLAMDKRDCGDECLGDLSCIACSDMHCNTTGHGKCGEDGLCLCDQGWSGAACEVGVCQQTALLCLGLRRCGAVR